MSADNYILIWHKSEGWSVEEVSTEGHQLEKIGTYNDIKDAIRAANAFMEDNEVEYGIQFTGV